MLHKGDKAYTNATFTTASCAPAAVVAAMLRSEAAVASQHDRFEVEQLSDQGLLEAASAAWLMP
jgi:hypothetical protein